jgi:hypothetical protein
MRGKGAKSVVGSLERMKRGNDIKHRGDKLSGIEVLMSETFRLSVFFFSVCLCVFCLE